MIDSGLARVGRYSARNRVQGLGVEPIAKANAVQRAGRCGRVAPGVCVRLYSEEDFAERPEFVEPEIQRTALAGVLLRLTAWRLGPIEEFPFIDRPPAKAVADAHQLLHVLGALGADRRLTRDGEAMARLPVDPRVARLLVVANRLGALREGLVIAAALSTVDPREYPADALDAARRQHDTFADPRSDFVTCVNLWRAYRRERRAGERAFRAWCRARFLSPSRLREWHDVHGQLRELALGLGWRARGAAADYKAIHQAVLAAFIDFVAEHVEGASYRGIRDSLAALLPGTPLAKKRPRWLVAAERVATERQYLRTVAQINPRWVLQIAPHLTKRHYLEPAWEAQRGHVTAREVVTLFGLTLTSERRVDYGAIEPKESRRLFLRDGLVAGNLGIRTDDPRLTFIEHNRRLRAEVLDAEARLRRRDLFIGEPAIAHFYDARLPPEVHDRSSLLRWCGERPNREHLAMTAADIASRELPALSLDRYPAELTVAGQEVPLTYHFEPGAEEDGVTLTLPHALLGALRAERLSWLIPGWLADKVLAWLRALAKDVRRELVPLPATVAQLLPLLERRAPMQDLTTALRDALFDARGIQAPPGAFDDALLPPHLLMRIVIVGADGSRLGHGRDLDALRKVLRGAESFAAQEDRAAWTRTALNHWDCGDLPAAVAVRAQPRDVMLYPGLSDDHGRVDLQLLLPGPAAVARHRLGVRRLLLKSLPQQTALIRARVLADRELVLCYHGIGSGDELVDDLLCASAEDSFKLEPPIRDGESFARTLEQGRAELVPAAERLQSLLRDLLSAHRQIRGALQVVDAARAEARSAILAQLERLITPYFFSSTPAEWRAHLPRYLKAAQQRWEKAAQRRAKDAELENDVREATARLDHWLATLPSGWPWPAAAVRYRWLLEEFRVSLFAQNLGTAVPVSAKRLEEQWRRVHEELAPEEGGAMSSRSAS